MLSVTISVSHNTDEKKDPTPEIPSGEVNTSLQKPMKPSESLSRVGGAHVMSEGTIMKTRLFNILKI